MNPPTQKKKPKKQRNRIQSLAGLIHTKGII